MDELSNEERAKIKEMIEGWDSVHLGIRAFSLIGNAIKWLAAVLTAVAVLWAVFTGHQPPTNH